MDAVGGLFSLGKWDPPDVIPVDPNTDLGYETAAIFARVGAEAGLTALTMGMSCASRVGTAINLLDTAGAIVATGDGLEDMVANGLTWQNGLQVAMGALGSLGILRNCFSRDTEVATPDGPRPIGEIEPGESVLAYDFETGCWNPRRVVERHDNHYIGALITLTTDQGAVRTTMYHPFWVISGDELLERTAPRELAAHESEGLTLPGRWVNSHDLRAGDVLIGQDGQPQRLLKLEQEYHEMFPVSNLTIETDHNYAVGPDALLVHNTPTCPSDFKGRSQAGSTDKFRNNFARAFGKTSKKGPIHHIATNKNSVSSVRGGPWTPRFERIFKRAGITLQNAVNKVRVWGHKGPHPEAYH